MSTQERVWGGSSPVPAASVDPASPVGTTLEERYRIDSLIAEGGMARVYRAEHLRLGRTVAVKILAPGYSQIPEVEKRFEREARAVARLDHPNCVSVQDLGQLEDGSLFLVMPYLAGPPLGEVIAVGALKIDRALHITRHVLRGLAHAHAQGVIHRDIKPDNILLVTRDGDEGFARILDFGIAKLVDGEPCVPGALMTQVGQRFGTPDYMAPEQVLGNPTDHRTDLYATACVLYEMLIGAPPFHGEDAGATMAMHAGKPAPDLASRSKRHFPRELEAVVARGLAKEPGDRFQSAEEFLRALDDLVGTDHGGEVVEVERTADQGKHTAARPAATRWSELARRLRQVPRLGWAAAAAAGLAFVALLVLWDGGPKAAGPTWNAEIGRMLLAEGKPEAVVEFYARRREAVARDPRSLLYLGHARATVRDYDSALGAYKGAVALMPRLGSDKTMRTNLRLMLEDVRGDVAAEAAEYLIADLDDEEAREKVVVLASQHESPRHRGRMRAVADGHHLGGRINRLRSYELDLEGQATCAERQKVVAKLRALGDPAAVPALREAAQRKGNACLAADAEDASKFLEGLAAASREE